MIYYQFNKFINEFNHKLINNTMNLLVKINSIIIN